MLIRSALCLPTLVIAGSLLSLGWPASSQAYCRTRGCDPKQQICPRDFHGCVTVEEELYWPGGMTDIWVDQAGSPLWNVSAADTQTALTSAIEHWTSVTCPDGQPLDLTVSLNGILETADTDANNVLSFLDEDSPYPISVVGMTLVQFAGHELQAADIVVNSEHQHVALDPMSAGEVDLEAVLTHELGHFLGLDHSDVPGATMQPEAMGFGSIDLRSLEADDVEGICAIYGRGRLPEPEPESEPSAGSDSSCSVTPGARGASSTHWSLLAALLLLARRQARKGWSQPAQ